jgi:4-diphosphocytidyl-2-C-methyl-D-erythritol kinase
VLETYAAPAKINLGLEVLYKRPDGYHEINTLFCRVAEPHDVVTVTRSDFFQLTCSEPSLPTDQRNLMFRAAEAFAACTREPLPKLHIHLEKNIPIGAGLGGGSSDAAVMLRILRDWYDSSNDTASNANLSTTLEYGAFLTLSAQLGADVPFFFTSAMAAQASGIGEKLVPLDVGLHASILVVFDPNIQISTREAYASVTPSESSVSLDYRRFFAHPPLLHRWKEQLRNDFEPEIFRRYPQLAEMKHALYSHGASFALMSGSGSSIYGLFEDPDIAEKAKIFFEQKGRLAFLSR